MTSLEPSSVVPTHPRPWLKRALRDPLLHFLTLGALVYGLHAARNRAADQAAITVEPEKRKELTALFQQRHGRAPNETELRGLVDTWVEEELLFREGLKLDLVRTDAELRDQLIARTRNLLAATPRAEPSEAEIAAFYAAHRADYTRPRVVSFTEYLFRESTDAERLASAALTSLRAGHSIPHVPMTYADRSETQLVSLYGAELAAEILALKEGSLERLRSTRGIHLIQVTRVTPQVQLSLAQVRTQVARQLALTRQKEKLALELARLKAEARVLEGTSP